MVHRQSSAELFSESSDEVRDPDVRLESDGTAVVYVLQASYIY